MRSSSWPRCVPPAQTTDAERVIVILSDLHLGLPAAPTPASLLPVLEGATEVILNGDSAESASGTFAAAGNDALAAFVDRAARGGATVLRIEGNHDPGSGELFAVRAGGHALVTHGHAFHPAIAPWSAAAGDVEGVFRREFDASGEPEPVRTLLAARAAALRERELDHARRPAAVVRSMLARPWAFPMVMGYWRIFPELSARFLERAAPQARVVASGHSHRAGAWLVRGRLVLNTGSFTFPGQPHAVTIDRDEVALVPLARRGGEWRQDAAGRRAWRIDAVASATA